MKVLFAADHAGFEMKRALLEYVKGLGHEVEDCGAYELDPTDDYPDPVSNAARIVSEDPQHVRAIILGASGQGEAIVANRFEGVRAVVYYGPASKDQVDAEGNSLSMLAATREHNDANMLSLGARYISEEEAQTAIEEWLNRAFSEDERHIRRINKIDMVQ